uniref:Adenosine receptor A3 n=1 Tax=Salvator merianae TaxID=96440 RepID=A0A8D0DHZ3_SALMN
QFISSSPAHFLFLPYSNMMGLDIVYIALESVITVLAILGNVVVICVMRLNPAFQKTTFYFVVSLAVADIGVGLVTPVAIVLILGLEILYDICLFMCCLLVIFTQASIISLLAIAIDRYLRIKLLTRYNMIITKKRICMALGITWLLSVLLGITPMFGWAEEREKNSSFVQCKFTRVMKMEFLTYLNFFIGTLVPLVVMLALYAKIFWIIRVKLRQCSRNVKGQGIFFRKEFRMAKSLALVLFLFAVCWLPMCIMNCIQHFYPTFKMQKYTLYAAILLSHSNSVINPIVYTFRIKKFRKTCIQILRNYILRVDPEKNTSYRLSTFAV